ncbi:MAG: extracellular solute-binding protein [Rhodospirillaceae bacterium]|nr:extracellular solute-binding protein [Rhodospirillaceae bacterium]
MNTLGRGAFFRAATLVTASSLALAVSATAALAEFSWDQQSGQSITVMMPEHPVTDGVRVVLDQFEADTGIDVNLQTMAEDLYFDRMEVALRGSGDTSQMDVYFLPMDSTAYTQHTNGLVHSLQGFIDNPDLTASDYNLDDIPAGFLDATKYEVGGSWEYHGIPASFETYILFANMDHVNEYLDGQVPTTMEALIAAAQEVKEESGGAVAGAVLRGIRSDTLIDTITGFVNNSVGAADRSAPYNVWFDGDWSKPKMNDPDIVRGLNNYAELMKAGPINIQAMDWPDASQFFMAGGAAFFIDASLFAPGFENPDDSLIAGKIGYSVIPIDNDEGEPYSAHWQWGFGIPQNAAAPEAGWLFIQYMSNVDNATAIGKLHGGAPRLSTWADSEYASSFPQSYVDAVAAAMPNSQTSVVQRAGWSEFALRIVDVIQDIYGGADPAEAGAAAQADFEKMLAN